MSAVSKRALTNLSSNGNAVRADLRASASVELLSLDADLTKKMEVIFSGTRLAVADDRFATIQREIRSVKNAWRDANTALGLICTTIASIKRTLDEPEYRAMVSGSDALFDFDKYKLSKFLAIGEKMERFAGNRLPGDYTTAYAIATLTDEQFEQAEARGLVRPSVKRHEITVFKRTLDTTSEPAGAARPTEVASILPDGSRGVPLITPPAADPKAMRRDLDTIEIRLRELLRDRRRLRDLLRGSRS